MLALVGSGEYLPPMTPVDNELIELLGEPPRVVCLPTAAGKEGHSRIDYWSELGVAHFKQLGAAARALPVIDRASACDSRWSDAIRQANFVYFSGGQPHYLHDTLNETPVWEAVLEVHRRGGLIAGCSAGAMIMGEWLPGFLHWERGFRLLPNSIIAPHFDELSPRLASFIRRLAPKGSTLIGVEGDTALVITEKGSHAAGSGGVTVWNSKMHRRFVDQELVTLH